MADVLRRVTYPFALYIYLYSVEEEYGISSLKWKLSVFWILFLLGQSKFETISFDEEKIVFSSAAFCVMTSVLLLVTNTILSFILEVEFIVCSMQLRTNVIQTNVFELLNGSYFGLQQFWQKA